MTAAPRPGTWLTTASLPLERAVFGGGLVSTEPSPRDPFAPVEASPAGATSLAVLALVAAVLAALTGVEALAGPLGMAGGLVAHVKGSRLGLPATAAAAVGMVVGMATTFTLL